MKLHDAARLRWLWSLAVLLVLLAVTPAALANISNEVPYSISFESYTNLETLLNGNNGWYGRDPTYAIITNANGNDDFYSFSVTTRP